MGDERFVGDMSGGIGQPLPVLSERQEYILSLVVREHIRSGQPVASKTLVDRFDLSVSSATVRNEMAVLEERQLIYAPHTSAGRVPTRLGYRYFVNRLLTGGDLLPRERERIAEEFRRAPIDVDAWMRIAAMALSRTARTAALVTPPRALDNRFKHLELIATQGRLVLMVLVLQSGAVQQQVLSLAEPVSQDVLSRTAQMINQSYRMLTADEVRQRGRSHTDALTGEVAELVADAMRQTNEEAARDVFRYGLSQVLPEFGEDAAQQAVRIMEERSLLDGILREVLVEDEGEVQVVVGGEGRWEDLSHLSIIVGRYGTPQTRGTLGVVGPTRMRYGRAIHAVRYVGGLLSGLIEDAYGNE